MSLNHCMSCMEPISADVCPHCGFSGQAQPEHALPYGTILRGRYLVGKMLGQGGFGITYVGWDLALEQKVAIKEYYPSGHVIRTGATGNVLHWSATPQALEFRENGVEGFLKEARKMARITRVPEATLVYDTFPENGTAYIVMEFVEGSTLKNRLAENGPYSWEQAKGIFLPAIRAMEAVHQAGIIHRDLSPDNLMLDTDGSVKILDLGAAKDLNINSGASSMVVAKDGFSPPEQYIQRGASGPCTDVYAMAATVYYSITGVLPPTAVERLTKDRLDWTLPRLTALPAGVVDALKNAMALAVEDRPQSMAALLSTLQNESAQEIPVSQKTTPKKNQNETKSKTTDQVAAKPSKKRPGKKKPALVCVILVLALLLASVGSYFICYNKAIELCQPGSFERAQKLLWFPAVTDLHDPELNSYVQSGVSLDQGNYSAAWTGFDKIYAYRNSPELVKETRYQWGRYCVDNKEYLQAYEIFLRIEGYKDTNSFISSLKDTLYESAQKLYRNEEFDQAGEIFTALSGYLRSKDYHYLIVFHTSKYPNTNSYNQLLRDLIGFEDASELIVSNHGFATAFLEGEWKTKTSNHYFKIDEEHTCRTNLPKVEYGEYYYYIRDGKYRLYKIDASGNSSTGYEGERACFTFTVLTEDSISIYCHIDGSTYTLYRQ